MLANGMLPKIDAYVGDLDHEFCLLFNGSAYDFTYPLRILNLKTFLDNECGEVKINEGSFAAHIEFSFDQRHYELNIFKQYGRCINVTVNRNINVSVDTNGEAAFNLNVTPAWEELLSFCNSVNAVDKVHQVGCYTETTTYDDGSTSCNLFLRATRQYLVTPNIGDIESFKKVLLELGEYVDKLCTMQMPNGNDWKKYCLSPVINESGMVASAYEHLFDKQVCSVWQNIIARRGVVVRNVDKDGKPITSKEILSSDKFNEEEFPLEFLADFSRLPEEQELSPLLGELTLAVDHTLIKKCIHFYKEHPYLAVFEMSFKCDCENEKAHDYYMEISNRWNSGIHFAPMRVVIEQGSDHTIRIKIIMTALLGDNPNFWTLAILHGDMQKNGLSSGKLERLCDFLQKSSISSCAD